MTVNTEHADSDIVATRISRLTNNESTWMEALYESGLNLNEPFTAKEAVAAIATTPLVSGGTRRLVPHSVKLCYVLRKTKKFESTTRRVGTNKTFWKLITNE